VVYPGDGRGGDERVDYDSADASAAGDHT